VFTAKKIKIYRFHIILQQHCEEKFYFSSTRVVRKEFLCGHKMKHVTLALGRIQVGVLTAAAKYVMPNFYLRFVTASS